VDKYPEKITTVWDTTQRRGKVFFDYNQNAKGNVVRVNRAKSQKRLILILNLMQMKQIASSNL
jgi:DNA primase